MHLTAANEFFFRLFIGSSPPLIDNENHLAIN